MNTAKLSNAAKLDQQDRAEKSYYYSHAFRQWGESGMILAWLAVKHTHTFSCWALLDSIGLFLSMGVPIPPGGGGGIPGDIPGLGMPVI